MKLVINLSSAEFTHSMLFIKFDAICSQQEVPTICVTGDTY